MQTQKNSLGQSGLPTFIDENGGEKNRMGIHMTDQSGTKISLSVDKIRDALSWAIKGYESIASVELIFSEVIKLIFDGIRSHELSDALILASSSFIERDPVYNFVSARLFRKKICKEVIGHSITHPLHDMQYRMAFKNGIVQGIAAGHFDARLGQFDLEALSAALVIERDDLFGYMGIKTLYERYFVKEKGVRLEMLQSFWMRVAMGLCYDEKNKTERAIEFYDLISTLAYVPSTPTLLHAGLTRPQLSSCFLTTIEDDLNHIFKCLGDNAQLSKWSGGVANDWTNLRATGSMIKSINTESQGVVPFLKIANDVTAAINRSGSRRGATCVYLEAWHLDVEDFLDLRKNTGDERRRTHDINTANWIPDLFMKRVLADQEWTLFCPSEVTDLHHIYGVEFEKRYVQYEAMAQAGEITFFKKVSAVALWRKMLMRLFETGHPWITFKDPCNIRSPQDHVGVVHSSNLCTEITLNTSSQETAVCNLGSINLAEHVVNGALDKDKLAATIKTAVRMLDNVIDINFYPTKEAQHANQKHRPIGLGLMGFQDALYKLNINFSDAQALTFADTSMEFVSYHAIQASAELAKERGAYASFAGSKWDRGIFPLDTLELLEKERGMSVFVNKTSTLDWKSLKEFVKMHGMRNSNTMAIAPTATISNIAGCIPCIEPIYKNLYVKANMSGEFTVVNKYLVEDLKELGLWDHDMLELLKYYDGSVQQIEHIPQHLKEKYKEVFEIDAEWLIAITAARGKWVDQSQSHNIFLRGTSGNKLSAVYLAAWQAGLKTTYYLRSLGASQIEKSTLDAKKFGFTQKRSFAEVAPKKEENQVNQEAFDGLQPKECSLSADPDCDVCQ